MGAPLSPAEQAYQLAHITENRGQMVVTVCSVLFGLDVVFVCTRFFARRTLKVKPGVEDWLIIPGLIMIGLMLVEMIYAVRFGLGKHVLATDPTEGYKILMIGFFLSLTYTLAHWCIKMSIIFFYIRIFGLYQKWFKIATYITIAYVSGWALSMLGFIFGQCQPLDYFWQRVNMSLDPPAVGVCPVNTAASAISTSALNTVGDFMVLALPVLHIIRLQLPPVKMAAVLSVFLVGIFTCTASIIRIVYTAQVLGNQQDTTYDAVDGYVWTVIEASVGLMCACFPIVGPLLKILRTKVSTQVSGSAGSKGISGMASSGGRSAHFPKRKDTLMGTFEELPEEEMVVLAKSGQSSPSMV